MITKTRTANRERSQLLPEHHVSKNKTLTGKGNGVLPKAKTLPYVSPYCVVVDQVANKPVKQSQPVDKEEEKRKLDLLGEEFKQDQVFGYVIEEAVKDAKVKVETDGLLARQALEGVWPKYIEAFKSMLQSSINTFNKTEKEIVDYSRNLSKKKLVTPEERGPIYKKLRELRTTFNLRVPMFKRQQEQYKDAELYLPRLLAKLEEGRCQERQGGYYYVADYLTWGEIQGHVRLGAKGFIFDSRSMGMASHPYLLAFDRGIPVILLSGARNMFSHLDPQVKIVINPKTGEVVVNIDDDNLKLLNAKIKEALDQEERFEKTVWTGKSKDEHPLPLPMIMENMGSDGAQTKEVGLYRTEDHYSIEMPTNPSLVRHFINAIEATNNLVIRLFDVDKDKYPKSESNFETFSQGKRGVEFLLEVEKGKIILRNQIRSLLVACDRLKYYPGEDGLAGKKIAVIIPMVKTPEQVEQVAQLIKQYEQELIADYTIDKRGVSQSLELGVMVETKEATEKLPNCKKFSIGGNDLSAAVLEVEDRAQLMTKKEYDWLSPKVLQYIFNTIIGVKGAVKEKELSGFSAELKLALQKHGYLLKVTNEQYVIKREPEADLAEFLAGTEIAELEKEAAYKLLKKTFKERRKGEVGFCGEMARDPLGALVLTLMGIDSLSMNQAWQKQIKYLLSYLHYGEWRKFENKLGKPVIQALLESKDAMAARKLLLRLAKRSKHYETKTVITELVKTPRPESYVTARKKKAA